MGDQGIATEEFENIVKNTSDELDTMEKDINGMIDFMDELKTVFNSNDMHKVSNNLDGINDSFQNIKAVTSSYIEVLREIEISYKKQAETVANEVNRLITD